MAHSRNDITASELRQLLNYDASTGVFTWKTRAAKSIHIGDIAGSKQSLGYIQIKLRGGRYLAHRLAWLYDTGKWPEDQIDHINGVCDDNRIMNLREATPAENQRNSRRRADNASGVKGVGWHAAAGRWQALIRFDGKKLYLGLFDSIEDAAAAYAAAAKVFHGEFMRLG